MDTLAISFASLVKSNNGEFKSEKQASFLLSKCLEDEKGKFFVASGQVFNSNFQIIYYCDEVGVTKTVKSTKSGESVTWERKTGVAAEEAKQEAALEKAKILKRREISAVLEDQKQKGDKMMDAIMSGGLKMSELDNYMADNSIMSDNEVSLLRKELKEI